MEARLVEKYKSAAAAEKRTPPSERELIAVLAVELRALGEKHNQLAEQVACLNKCAMDINERLMAIEELTEKPK